MMSRDASLWNLIGWPKLPLAPLFIQGPDPDPNRERRWKELFSTVDVNGNGAVEILRLQFLKS